MFNLFKRETPEAQAAMAAEARRANIARNHSMLSKVFRKPAEPVKAENRGNVIVLRKSESAQSNLELMNRAAMAMWGDRPARQVKSEKVTVTKRNRSRTDRARHINRSRAEAATDATRAVIEQIVASTVDEVLDRVLAKIAGTSLQKHEAEVATRRNELRLIDARIALNTSGLINTMLPEPTGITKADHDEDRARWRRSMGLDDRSAQIQAKIDAIRKSEREALSR